MKRILLFFLLVISVHAQSQKTVTPNWVKSVAQDTATALRAEIALKLDITDTTNIRTFSDLKYANKSLSNLGTTAINVNLLPNINTLNLGGSGANQQWYTLYANRWYFKGSNYNTLINILDPTQGRNIYFPNASGTIALISDIDSVNISYPDANTIQIATGETIQLDPATLEMNGSNQLTVIGGVGGGSGGLFETDGNGDLMPNDAEVTDTYYELDGNGDIQPL